MCERPHRLPAMPARQLPSRRRLPRPARGTEPPRRRRSAVTGPTGSKPDRPPHVPSAYADGRRLAARIDPAMTDLYIRHLSTADPPADRAVAAIAHLPDAEIASLVEAGLSGDDARLRAAPAALRDYFAAVPTTPPSWWDPDLVRAARTAFHGDAEIFMEAFFAATLRIAATRVSKSVASTGAVPSSHGVNRIRHSSHHLVETMLPGSLAAHADGWKICVHVRLVHAATRRLLLARSGWDPAEHGAPICAAHLALASANYSAGLLDYVALLGIPVDAASRRGFIQIWHYVSTLLGIPDALLFDGDEAHMRLYRRIAEHCEPRPDADAAAVANSVVRILPDLLGQTDPRIRAATVRRTYRLMRALLGRETADCLGFPDYRIACRLSLRRARQRLRALVHRLHPPTREAARSRNLALLLEYAVLPSLSWRLPPIAPPPGCADREPSAVDTDPCRPDAETPR